MTNQNYPEKHDPPRDTVPRAAELSMMAVQELLGLFSDHQIHATRTTSDAGDSTSEMQAALENKPLTYV